ncbi:MAG: Flp pilus assembly complex ATPase component TadA [Phycisphaerales bacterium]|nr:Flp pilus assembly complex ATPase component TadA [Phycisphaerales bacterium]
MPKLRLFISDPSIEPILLSDTQVTIGRHPDNQIAIEDDLASRFHCVVQPSGRDRYVLKDLGSRNGTKLNGQRITQEFLSPGDRFRVGSVEFRLELTEPESVPEAAPPPARSRGGGRAKSVALPPWAAELQAVVDNLPEAGLSGQTITLIDANGKPSAALDGSTDGALAGRLLLAAANASRATDIHCEPKGDQHMIRMRVDGSMVQVVELPNQTGELFMGLIRNACNFPSVARDAVLDGHVSARYADRRVDFRASFTPTVFGPKLVLRILDSNTAPRSLHDLSLPAFIHQRIKRVCDQDAGMLLVVGPTGSGKTTTLYNALREIDRQRFNVVTIEDPVEYNIEGVTQIPVTPNSSFSEILRSVLRQDPDVILVGEIRDSETARTAMQAAMTGHVVFTTVHAKDTIGAVFRLLDLGVEPYLVANSLDVILAQRLVRVLCEHCRRAVKVTPGQATRIGRFLEGKTQTYVAVGCPRCLRTGFHGRRAIFEMLDFNDELRDLVLREPSIQGMKKIIEQGVFATLQQSGWQLAARGVTTLEEVDAVSSWS